MQDFENYSKETILRELKKGPSTNHQLFDLVKDFPLDYKCTAYADGRMESEDSLRDFFFYKSLYNLDANHVIRITNKNPMASLVTLTIELW